MRAFWINAVDAANTYLTEGGRDDLALLGQGDWRLPLIRLGEDAERREGRSRAEDCRVLAFCRVWGFCEPLVAVRLGWEQKADLCAFIMQRVRHMEASDAAPV